MPANDTTEQQRFERPRHLYAYRYRYPHMPSLGLDTPSRTVFIGGRVVRLSTLEFQLLRVLVENAPRVVAYDDLLTAVWGNHATDKRNYLKLYVRYLRSKLEEDASHPCLIVNERSQGYRLAWPRRTRPAPDSAR